MWWIIDVSFSHVLDENNLTQAQEKCLDLEIQATNVLYRYMEDNIFGEIIDMKTTHEIWIYLNEKYRIVSNNDDDEDPKEETHENVEHDHNLVIVEDCSTLWSSDDDDRSTISSLDKVDDDATSDAIDDDSPSTLFDDGSCRRNMVGSQPRGMPKVVDYR